MSIDYDSLSTEEIKELIREGIVTEKDVVDYYNNEWWDETP